MKRQQKRDVSLDGPWDNVWKWVRQRDRLRDVGVHLCVCRCACGYRWFIRVEVELSPLFNELLTRSVSCLPLISLHQGATSHQDLAGLFVCLSVSVCKRVKHQAKCVCIWISCWVSVWEIKSVRKWWKNVWRRRGKSVCVWRKRVRKWFKWLSKCVNIFVEQKFKISTLSFFLIWKLLFFQLQKTCVVVYFSFLLFSSLLYAQI